MLKPLSPTDHAAAIELDERANARLLRGLTLLEANTPASLREAAICFEEAIDLRARLPVAENSGFRYGLIAGWMNRGDALTRLGAPDGLSEALRCYDEALAHLRELPMGENPLFIKRLAIAWMNRGVTLLAQGTPGAAMEAVQCFDDALAAAKNFSGKNEPEGRVLLANAGMNRANALIRLTPPQPATARAALRHALELLVAPEKTAAAAAAISFRARHIWCQALALELSTKETTLAAQEELLAEAADTVDAGMALARHWETRGANEFREPAAELFHFGCRVYQTHQAHFLTEFLLENLDPACSKGAFTTNLQMHGRAREALWRALGALQREGFKTVNTPRFDAFLEQLRELRVTDERLAELRRNCATE